jgi:hypothetical protein
MARSNYQYLFHEALQRAFAATAPSVRCAYFDLADFYRNKLGDSFQPNPPAEFLKRLASQRKDPA